MADTLVFSLEDSLPSLTTWLARWDPQQGAEVLAETPLDVDGDLILSEATSLAGDRWYVTGDLPELPASGSLYAIGEVASSASVFLAIPPGSVPGPNSVKFLTMAAFDGGGGNVGVSGGWLYSGLHPDAGNIERSLDAYDGIGPQVIGPGRHVFRLSWRPNFMEYAVDGVVVSTSYEESGGGVPLPIPITQIQLAWDVLELAYWANPTNDPNGHVAAENAYLGLDPDVDPEPEPFDDAVPTDALVLDFNPRTQFTSSPQEVTQLEVSGRVFWSGYDSTVTARAAVNDDGFRTMRFPTTFASELTQVGMDPHSWVYAFKSQADLNGNILGRHAASLTINGTKGAEGTTWSSGTAPAGNTFLSPNDQLVVLIGVLADGVLSWYADGVLQATGPMNGYLPADTPSFLGSAETFRTLFYDRGLTQAQVTEMTALLKEMYTPKVMVSWTAPPSTGAIEAYVVSRLLPGGTVETVELAPTVLTLEVGAGETVLISARNEHGLSSPVQAAS